MIIFYNAFDSVRQLPASIKPQTIAGVYEVSIGSTNLQLTLPVQTLAVQVAFALGDKSKLLVLAVINDPLIIKTTFMLAMNYRGPYRVRIRERPMPEILHPEDAAGPVC